MHLHEWVITWILLTFAEVLLIIYTLRRNSRIGNNILTGITIVYLAFCISSMVDKIIYKTYIGGKRSFCEEHIKITHKNVEDHTTIQEKCTRFAEYVYTESGSWKRIGDIRE